MLRSHTMMTRFSTLAVVSLALAALVPGCAKDTVLDAEDYDQTCTTAADCVSVLTGNMCGCSCDFGAIAKSELEKFQADDAAARQACGDSILTCGACPDSPPVACATGTCTFME